MLVGLLGVMAADVAGCKARAKTLERLAGELDWRGPAAVDLAAA